MAEFQPIRIGQNLLAGQQGAQQVQSNRQANELRALQLQQGQQQMSRDEQFRNQLGTYLQGGTNALAAMYRADPERAMQVQAFQGQQNQIARQQEIAIAKESYGQAQAVIASKAPADYFRILMPDKAAALAKQLGKDVDELTDEDATGIAERVSAIAGAKAGILPEYSNPEAAQIDGKDVFAQFEKTSGRPRVLEGVGPRPQRPLVSVGIGEEKAEAKKVGEGMGEMYVSLQQAGSVVPAKLAKLDRMEQLMEGVSTGKLTPAITQVAAIAQSLGFEVDTKLGAKQALEALSNEIALTLRNPSGGAGMPGALSNKDREFLTSMTPGLAKTPEGNKLIIQTARNLAKREQEVAKLARAYRKKNGSLDEGFYDELADFSAAHPLFGKEAAPVVTNDGWIIKEQK